MTAVVELSTRSRPDFPDEWYEIAPEGHFWFEWRFRAFLGQLDALGLPIDRPWHGLDLGCGHGVTRAQIERWTAWTTDGADLNRVALAQNRTRVGEAYYYDVHDRRPELSERYDFVLIFDVLEHLERPREFVASALHHLRPGGLLCVNVPAVNGLMSEYDRVVGHLRRYDKSSLRAELDPLGLEILDLRYWGFSMLPYLLVRRLSSNVDGSDRRVIERGFSPPMRWTEWPIRQIMRLETRLLRSPLLGTSVLLAARKPEAAGTSA